MDKKIIAKPRRGNARARILDAALQLVSEGGPEAFTLEAVAARAGVSRSGLLYHFAIKESLMVAAAEAIVEGLCIARAAEAAALPDLPNRFLNSYVLASVTNRAGNDRITAKALAAGPIPSEAIRRYWKQRFLPLSRVT